MWSILEKLDNQMKRTARYGHRFRSTKALTIALHERDEHTRHHCDRVVMLAEALGRALGISKFDMDELRLCARFHDVGKIGIPDAILLKESRFDDQEWEFMKTHSEKGERIIKATTLPGADKIAKVIRHHHENYDGSGYPDGLRAEAIPFLSQIVALVDAYDAMRSVRPYRQARSKDEVMSILDSESGWKFAPAIFEKFPAIVEKLSPRYS
tara:strand:+ start:942 stop:1574 length:633 start_codon:yes stop_codon:yes gene_type:complete